MRVKLIKSLCPDKFPVDSLGTVIRGRMDGPGMLLVEWDAGFIIPMYRGEVEVV